jgi:hypothetical protein
MGLVGGHELIVRCKRVIICKAADHIEGKRPAAEADSLAWLAFRSLKAPAPSDRRRPAHRDKTAMNGAQILVTYSILRSWFENLPTPTAPVARCWARDWSARHRQTLSR